MRFWLVLLLVCALVCPAYAAEGSPPFSGAGYTNPTISGFTSPTTIPNTAGGTKLLGPAPGGSPRLYLDIENQSNPTTGAILACSFGVASVPSPYSGASLSWPPLGGHTWEGNFVPSDQVNCICSVAGGCTVTVVAYPG